MGTDGGVCATGLLVADHIADEMVQPRAVSAPCVSQGACNLSTYLVAGLWAIPIASVCNQALPERFDIHYGVVYEYRNWVWCRGRPTDPDIVH